MSSATLTPVPHDGRMDASQPRLGGRTRRRSFTPAQKLDHVAAYEAALTLGDSGASTGRRFSASASVIFFCTAGIWLLRSAATSAGTTSACTTSLSRLCGTPTVVSVASSKAAL